MNIKKHIPNLITLINLFCGCIAVVFAFNQNVEMAFFFVALGIFFDFFDGFFARLFNVTSPLGLQLDSLADMVTSGVVPGTIMFFMLTNALNIDISNFDITNLNFWFALCGYVITLGSCFRLANFNIDTRQTDSFIGLPTPANALFILSLPLILKNTDSLIILGLLTDKWFLLVITLFSAYILNAEIPLFALKIKNFSFQKYKLQIGFVLFSVIMIVMLQFLAIPLIIISYVLLSVVNNMLTKK
jgi:CDP-diacylglycerol---serine O-phosphatidyltransferase